MHSICMHGQQTKLYALKLLKKAQKAYVKRTQHHDHVERACSTPLTPQCAAAALCGHKSAQPRSGWKMCSCDWAQKVATAARNKRVQMHISQRYISISGYTGVHVLMGTNACSSAQTLKYAAV